MLECVVPHHHLRLGKVENKFFIRDDLKLCPFQMHMETPRIVKSISIHVQNVMAVLAVFIFLFYGWQGLQGEELVLWHCI